MGLRSGSYNQSSRGDQCIRHRYWLVFAKKKNVRAGGDEVFICACGLHLINQIKHFIFFIRPERATNHIRANRPQKQVARGDSVMVT